jgi:hypothetical protein
MMVDCKTFKGIEYVQLNELPQSQREKLVQTINNDLFIKILIDGTILNNCLQFKDYLTWYNNVFQTSETIISEDVDIEAPARVIAGELVFK